MNSQGVVSCQGPSKTFELWEPLEATASGTGLAQGLALLWRGPAG